MLAARRLAYWVAFIVAGVAIGWAGILMNWDPVLILIVTFILGSVMYAMIERIHRRDKRYAYYSRRLARKA